MTRSRPVCCPELLRQDQLSHRIFLHELLLNRLLEDRLQVEAALVGTGGSRNAPTARQKRFIFPNARKRNGAKKNGFIRTDNYRARVLKKPAEKLGLTKLNFQVLRRTMATLAQTKGGVKDVQGVLGHSKADTTVNVYMQQIEAGVKQTIDAIYVELTAKPEVAAGT